MIAGSVPGTFLSFRITVLSLVVVMEDAEVEFGTMGGELSVSIGGVNFYP